MKKLVCPYHKERTPSCVLKVDKFHCFGCGEEGSIEKLNTKLVSVGRKEITDEK